MWPERLTMPRTRAMEGTRFVLRGSRKPKWTSQTSRRIRITGCMVLVLGITGMTILYSSLRHVPVPRLRFEYGNNHSPPPTIASSRIGSTIAAAGIPSSSPRPRPPSIFGPPDGSPFNESKIALLIEDRAVPHLAPLLLHMMAVVPPDWRFIFMGSPSSLSFANRSHALRTQVSAGKLELTRIPANISMSLPGGGGGGEMISRFLTSRFLYETLLPPKTEWLLIFQTDSVLCANSRHSLDDFLGYDWVGSPWDPRGRFGGNGGLSLRRVSAIVEVLRDQVRIEGSEPEDVWLTERLGHRPGARMANGSLSLTFSGEMNAGENVRIYHPSSASSSASSSYSPIVTEGSSHKGKINKEEENDDNDEDVDGEAYYIEGVDDWRDDFYEPMGYHTGGSGTILHSGVWGTPALRKHIWDYCPEVKMTLAMDLAKYVPGDCQVNWKRDSEDAGGAFKGISDISYETEVIDGLVYPKLPSNLVP